MILGIGGYRMTTIKHNLSPLPVAPGRIEQWQPPFRFDGFPGYWIGPEHLQRFIISIRPIEVRKPDGSLSKSPNDYAWPRADWETIASARHAFERGIVDLATRRDVESGYFILYAIQRVKKNEAFALFMRSTKEDKYGNMPGEAGYRSAERMKERMRLRRLKAE